MFYTSYMCVPWVRNLVTTSTNILCGDGHTHTHTHTYCSHSQFSCHDGTNSTTTRTIITHHKLLYIYNYPLSYCLNNTTVELLIMEQSLLIGTIPGTVHGVEGQCLFLRHLKKNTDLALKRNWLVSMSLQLQKFHIFNKLHHLQRHISLGCNFAKYSTSYGICGITQVTVNLQHYTL